MRRSQLRPGHILELGTRRGLAYLQYVGKHPLHGDVIQVLSGFHQERPADLDALVAKKRGYYAFYPARASVAAGFVEIVSRTAKLSDGVGIPDSLRRHGVIDSTGKVLTWIVEREGVDSVHTTLADSDRALPIAAVWDHVLLVEYVTDEWTPSKEV